MHYKKRLARRQVRWKASKIGGAADLRCTFDFLASYANALQILPTLRFRYSSNVAFNENCDLMILPSPFQRQVMICVALDFVFGK